MRRLSETHEVLLELSDSAEQEARVPQLDKPLNDNSIELISVGRLEAKEKSVQQLSINLPASQMDLALKMDEDDESEEAEFHKAIGLASFSLNSEEFDFEKNSDQEGQAENQAQASEIKAAIYFHDIRDRQRKMKFVPKGFYLSDQEIQIKRHESAMQHEGNATWQLQRAEEHSNVKRM